MMSAANIGETRRCSSRGCGHPRRQRTPPGSRLFFLGRWSCGRPNRLPVAWIDGVHVVHLFRWGRSWRVVVARELFQRFIDEGMIGQAYCSTCDIVRKILIAPVDFSIIKLTFRWFSSGSPFEAEYGTIWLLFVISVGDWCLLARLGVASAHFRLFLAIRSPDKRLKLASVDPLP